MTRSRVRGSARRPLQRETPRSWNCLRRTLLAELAKRARRDPGHEGTSPCSSDSLPPAPLSICL